LLEASRDLDADVRAVALSRLEEKIAEAPAFTETAFAVFAENLQHEKSPVRAKAIWGICRVQEKVPALIRDVIPLISRLLDDPDVNVRRGTVTAFAGIGAPVLNGLVVACRDDDKNVRSVALNGIRRIGRPARDASAVVLENLMQEESPTLRRESVFALESLGALDDPVVIATAIDRLNNETDFEVADTIARALSGIQQATVAIERYLQRKKIHYDYQAEHEQLWRSGGSGPSSVRGGDPNDPMSYWYGEDSVDRESEIDPRTLSGDRGIGGTF
jgi:hypothetical protein